MKVGLVQLRSGPDKATNLAAADRAVSDLAGRGVDLVLLPEMFNYHGSDDDNAAAAEPIPGPSSDWAGRKALAHGIYLHLGSLIERRGDALFNTSVVYDRSGREAARYSKIHLFDVRLPDGTAYLESQALSPGDQVVVFPCEEVLVGLAICYDLRFPELFRALADRGAQVYLIPAAFTVPTGISHWEPLLRARAIENGCYVVACGQWGPFMTGRACYGHSMVVDPWGVVVAQCGEREDTLVAELDLEHLRAVRERMPVHRHRRRDLFG